MAEFVVRRYATAALSTTRRQFTGAMISNGFVQRPVPSGTSATYVVSYCVTFRYDEGGMEVLARRREARFAVMRDRDGSHVIVESGFDPQLVRPPGHCLQDPDDQYAPFPLLTERGRVNAQRP